jgi:hypothetical protein
MNSQANPSCSHLHPRPQLAELQDYSHNQIRELQPQLQDLYQDIYTPHISTTTSCICRLRHSIPQAYSLSHHQSLLTLQMAGSFMTLTSLMSLPASNLMSDSLHQQGASGIHEGHTLEAVSTLLV